MLLAGLACTMRGYQRRALAWMASREAYSLLPSEQEGRPSMSSTGRLPPAIWRGTPHPSWQQCLLPSGLPFYHNWMTGAPPPLLSALVCCIQQAFTSFFVRSRTDHSSLAQTSSIALIRHTDSGSPLLLGSQTPAMITVGYSQQ